MEHKYLQNKMLISAASFILMCVIGYLDYITGYKISFSIFYLLPIGLITWYVDRQIGLLMAVFGGVVWFIADYMSSPAPQDILVYYWNALVWLGFSVIVVLLLAKLKMSLEIEQRLARIDFLTGIPNRHDFSEMLFVEMERARRYSRPLSLVYIDCDNFKKINDELGHEQGDLLLKEMANCLLQNTRKTDKVARMGGDEFVVLLPETNETQTREIMLRVHVKLLTVMELYKWRVTFSIGAVTFEDVPLTSKDAINEADKMMYQAKEKGKNQLATKTIRSMIEQANKRWT